MRNAKNLVILPWGSRRIARLLAILLGCSLAAFAQAPAPDSPAIEAKAHALVAKLTLEQKIRVCWAAWTRCSRMPAPPSACRASRCPTPGGRAHLGTDHRLCRAARPWPPPGIRLWRASSASAWARTPAPAASISCSAPASTSPARPSAGRNFEYLSEDPFLKRHSGRSLHPGRPVPGRDRHGQALCPEQPGVQPAQRQLRRGRAHHARDLSAGL